MPNKHASIKDVRKSKKRAAKNARMKMHVKSLTRQVTDLLKQGNKDEAVKIGQKLQQAVAKASKNHVFHANKGNRKISKLHKTLAKTA